MQPIIQVSGLSKRYVIRHQAGVRYLALRDVIMDSIRGAGRAILRPNTAAAADPSHEEFWALRDVSFEVSAGDVVGIIGRNGAGKSTLLKVLSRITEPTHGRIELHGRAASLLEVGTGFHPELTGRENIQLNGAILGMRREEIRQKFDQIVAFAEVEKFLDTPVKHYSSGMYVRLAFSVAAHLDPEILIVDEVLAVGDIEFQKKCLGKMHEVSKGGRTVLFVSHNMGAVQTLCRSAIYLDAGRVRRIGPSEDVIAEYVADSTGGSSRLGESMRMHESLFLDACEMSPNPVASGAPVRFHQRVRSTKPTRVSEMTFLVVNPQGHRVGVVDLRPYGLPKNLGAGETLDVKGEIDSFPMVEGDYSTMLYIVTSDFSGDFANLPGVTVSPRPATGGLAPYAAVYRGSVEYDYTAAMQVESDARA